MSGRLSLSIYSSASPSDDGQDDTAKRAVHPLNFDLAQDYTLPAQVMGALEPPTTLFSLVICSIRGGTNLAPPSRPQPFSVKLLRALTITLIALVAALGAGLSNRTLVYRERMMVGKRNAAD